MQILLLTVLAIGELLPRPSVQVEPVDPRWDAPVRKGAAGEEEPRRWWPWAVAGGAVVASAVLILLATRGGEDEVKVRVVLPPR